MQPIITNQNRVSEQPTRLTPDAAVRFHGLVFERC